MNYYSVHKHQCIAYLNRKADCGDAKPLLDIKKKKIEIVI